LVRVTKLNLYGWTQ